MPSTSSKEAAKAVLILAAAGAVLFTQSGTIEKTENQAQVDVCADGKCQTVQVTQEDVQIVREDIADKVDKDIPLTIEEWKAYIAFVNQRLEGGRDLGSVDSPNDLKQSLTNLLYEQ